MNKEVKVTIELNKEEYLKLTQLVYMGEWMVNSHREDPIMLYEKLIDRINEKSASFEMGNLIHRDNQADRYVVTDEFESYLDEYIDDYDHEVFWDELIYRMSDRDMLTMVGAKKLDVMSASERMALQLPLIEKYQKDFDEWGVDHLFLKSDLI